MLRAFFLATLALGIGHQSWFRSDIDAFVRIVGGVASIAVGLVALMVFTDIIRGKYRVLIFAPEGFQDTNIAKEFVPWSAVTTMSVAPT
jgi:hypothetical protein